MLNLQTLPNEALNAIIQQGRTLDERNFALDELLTRTCVTTESLKQLSQMNTGYPDIQKKIQYHLNQQNHIP